MSTPRTIHEAPSAQRPSIALAIGIFLTAFAVLAIHAWQHLPFISDDALISLRYSERLLHGYGLTWASGPRVEGYTNLLWVLACSMLGALGVDPIDASRAWGFIGMGAALAAIIFAFRPHNMKQLLPAIAGAVGIALTAPLAVWTIGGLEQPFVAAFLAWALVLCFKLVDVPLPTWRNALPASLMLGLLCLTRSDGGVLCIAVALGLAMARGLNVTTFKLVFALAIFPILFGGGQVIFRLVYYDEWLPNPAHVKVAFTMDRILDGWTYVRQALPYLAGIFIPTIFTCILGLGLHEIRRHTLLFSVPLFIWIAYVTLIGGDVFPTHRHVVPTLICAGLLIAHLTKWAIAQSRAAHAGAWIVVAGMFAVTIVLTARDPEVQRAKEERWEWDGKVVGEMLQKAFGEMHPLIACDPAGCIPYFSKLDAIDMMGLNDYTIARARDAQFGRGVLGHELGDGKYVLDRKPDLVLWTLPTGMSVPLFASAQQMNADPAFHQAYRFVLLRSPPPNGLRCGIWARFDSPKIGVRNEAGRIIIPALFAASTEQTPAVLDDNGRLGVYTVRGQLASFKEFGPPPGTWRIRAEADAPMLIAARPIGGGDPIVDGLNEVTLTVPPSGAFYDFQFAPAGKNPVLLRNIVFEPLPK
ncbi:MAG: hypothetical protein AABZ08_03050 [Planctomycetota bacterium]